MPDPRLAAAIVLAAGEGTRMRSTSPKVLHTLCGRTMLGHVVAATQGLAPQHHLVVVGHGRDEVARHLAEVAPSASAVVQETQDGTGHAVRVALATTPDLSGTVVVVPGDAPLLTTELLGQLVQAHEAATATVTLLTAVVPDPTGYGRVLRDSSGTATAVVEHRDATAEQREIHEVATSVYAFDGAYLRTALGQLRTDNSQREQYLTDVVAAAATDGRSVAVVVAPDWQQTLGVNDQLQLADARARLRDRLVEAALRVGAVVTDPRTTWLGVDVVLEPGCVVHPNTQLHGQTVVRRGAVVGPDTTLTRTEVGEDARVIKSHCEDAVIGPGANVGPYTYLRPGTVLGAGAKAGAYVEIKASTVGAGSKVPHLSYVGDATIGARSNIGAATVVVNYDGRDKHRTTVGDDVRIGSDTMLVAPVSVGDGAYTAAGSVITTDVPAGALGVGRARQRNIEGWVHRRRGTSGSDTTDTMDTTDTTSNDGASA